MYVLEGHKRSMNISDQEINATARRALSVRGWELLSLHPGAGAALAQLRQIHRQLWALEDQARSRLACNTTIAAVKRTIDRANAERHGHIDRIDSCLVWPAPVVPNPRLFSETPGELADRLVIIDLKISHLAALVGDPTLTGTERESCSAHLARQRGWQTHLQDCFVEQLTELAAGRGIAPPRAELKLYNDRRLNPVTRAEDVSEEYAERPR